MSNLEQQFREDRMLRNAARAMTDAKTHGPRIDVSADLVADTVITRITDNGPGLPESVGAIFP